MKNKPQIISIETENPFILNSLLSLYTSLMEALVIIIPIYTQLAPYFIIYISYIYMYYRPKRAVFEPFQLKYSCRVENFTQFCQKIGIFLPSLKLASNAGIRCTIYIYIYITTVMVKSSFHLYFRVHIIFILYSCQGLR